LSRTFVLPDAITKLSEERPDIHVSVVEGPYNDLLHGLHHGDLDMLTGALREPSPTDDVVQECLFEAPLAVVARRTHPLAGEKEQISLTKLAAYSWAIPTKGTPTRTAFDLLFADAPLKPTTYIESSSWMLIRSLLLDSDRLTIISAHQIMHEEAFGQMIRLPVTLPATNRDIGVTIRKGWHPTAGQGRFLALLRDAAALV
jgi:LysR family transcriptional regulator of gallate degradation